MTNLQVGRLVADAQADIEATLRTVAAARAAPWRSVAADRYRDALDELCWRLATCRDAVHAAAGPALALDELSPFAGTSLS